MATQLGRYQTLNFMGWKGTTKDNHIGAIFQKSPQKATNFMIELLAYRRGKVLESYLAKLPRKEFETDDEITWEVIGGSRRNIPILSCRDASGTEVTTGNVGVGGLPFYTVFAEDWFADGNVIVGELNEVYPIRVLGDPMVEGTNYVYKCELMGGILTGIPASELSNGKRFSVEYSPVEREFSRKVGDIRFTSPISLRNEFSTIRISHTVPGNSLNKKLAVGLPVMDKNGNKTTYTTWMHYVDYQLEETFSDEKNHALVYGRSNRNSNGEYLNYGKSGNVIKLGAGINEQREVSGVIYYNTFRLKLIEDALYSLATSKLGMSDRRFIIRTGERGATAFHKEVLNVTSGWTAIASIDAAALGMIQKTQSNLHSNALTAGFQFTEFKAPNGLVIKVEVDPMYDDEVRNKIRHPLGGVAMSYRFDIDYIGSMDEPNIQLASIRNEPELHGYQAGFRNPFTGQINNNNMSFDIDGAIFHKQASFGAIVFDATKCISLIPAILRG